ncbi:MAG: glycosyltransferase, partial [Pseudomonadota bacterium]
MPLRILIYAQHLLGVGHVFRAKRVADAAAVRGHAVTLVLGGAPVPGLQTHGLWVHQLTPLRARDATYQVIETVPEGEPLNDAIAEARRDQLLSIYDATAPDVIVLEGFPFARRKFRFELVPLLERAQAKTSRPTVVVSARDVLQRPSKPSRLTEAFETFDKFCDALLLHGDPETAASYRAFPELETLSDVTYYTGVIAPEIGTSSHDAARVAADVVVSVGGGAVGLEVLSGAIAAKPLTELRDASWLLLAGPNCPAADFERLRDTGGAANIVVKRFVPNLRDVMARATLSISQAGYNTVADLLTTSCRAVLIPFAEHGQTEQPARANGLHEAGRAIALPEADLSAPALADAITRALKLPAPIAQA